MQLDLALADIHAAHLPPSHHARRYRVPEHRLRWYTLRGIYNSPKRSLEQHREIYDMGHTQRNFTSTKRLFTRF